VTRDRMHALIFEAERSTSVADRLYVAGLVIVGLADVAPLSYRLGATHFLISRTVRKSDSKGQS